jgi:hypothetical protein
MGLLSGLKCCSDWVRMAHTPLVQGPSPLFVGHVQGHDGNILWVANDVSLQHYPVICRADYAETSFKSFLAI